MLQTERSHALPYPESETAPQEASFSIPELISIALGFLQRRLLVVVIAFLVVTAIGEPIVFKLVPALYNATATLLIDNRGAKIDPKTGAIDGYLLEAQIAIIKSENIRLLVARKLHLAEDSEFGIPRPGILGTLLGTANIASDQAREARALGVLDTNLTAKRTGANYVIEISYKSRDAERAASVESVGNLD